MKLIKLDKPKKFNIIFWFLATCFFLGFLTGIHNVGKDWELTFVERMEDSAAKSYSFVNTGSVVSLATHNISRGAFFLVTGIALIGAFFGSFVPWLAFLSNIFGVLFCGWIIYSAIQACGYEFSF